MIEQLLRHWVAIYFQVPKDNIYIFTLTIINNNLLLELTYRDRNHRSVDEI